MVTVPRGSRRPNPVARARGLTNQNTEPFPSSPPTRAWLTNASVRWKRLTSRIRIDHDFPVSDDRSPGRNCVSGPTYLANHLYEPATWPVGSRTAHLAGSCPAPRVVVSWRVGLSWWVWVGGERSMLWRC